MGYQENSSAYSALGFILKYDCQHQWFEIASRSLENVNCSEFTEWLFLLFYGSFLWTEIFAKGIRERFMGEKQQVKNSRMPGKFKTLKSTKCPS